MLLEKAISAVEPTPSTIPSPRYNRRGSLGSSLAERGARKAIAKVARVACMAKAPRPTSRLSETGE